MVRIPKIQDMLGINLKNYPPDVIKGAPLLPWIVGEIKRKTRNHWATHDMPAIAFFSDEVRLLYFCTTKFRSFESLIQRIVKLFSQILITYMLNT